MPLENQYFQLFMKQFNRTSMKISKPIFKPAKNMRLQQNLVAFGHLQNFKLLSFLDRKK